MLMLLMLMDEMKEMMNQKQIIQMVLYIAVYLINLMYVYKVFHDDFVMIILKIYPKMIYLVLVEYNYKD